MLPFELTKDTPYLALSGELWSVFYEYFNRNWSCYKGFLLYTLCTRLAIFWCCAGLLHWHWGDNFIVQLTVKQCWRIRIKLTCTQPQQNAHRVHASCEALYISWLNLFLWGCGCTQSLWRENTTIIICITESDNLILWLSLIIVMCYIYVSVYYVILISQYWWYHG